MPSASPPMSARDTSFPSPRYSAATSHTPAATPPTPRGVGPPLRGNRGGRGVGLVVGDVEIEVAVAVHVGQRGRRAPLARRIEAEVAAGLGGVAVPVVQEDRVRAGGREEDQV